MQQWVMALSVLEKIYFFTAIIGSFLFLIRVAIMFIGAGHAIDTDGDFDTDLAGHADGHLDGHVDHGEGLMTFKLLTLQGITAFLMMFGWVGLAISRGYSDGGGNISSFIGGCVAGLGTVWITDKIFRFFATMQHSGTMSLQQAVNEEGSVYLTIPADGIGKVRLTVGGRLRVLDATSEEGTELPTDTRIRVVKVINDNVMVVRKT